MRAGLLRYTAVFSEPVKQRTATGASSIVYQEVFRCRAAKKRFSNVTDKDKVEAKEEFYGHFGVIQVRFSPKIKDNQVVDFLGERYKIILLDYQPDNTYLINLNKVNE